MSGPRNQTRKAGEQAVLECHTRARPDNVTVQWLRDGVEVTRLAELRGRLKQADNGSLVLNGLHRDDQGRYTCQASNGIGTAQRASAFLQVHCEYRASRGPPPSCRSTVSTGPAEGLRLPAGPL